MAADGGCARIATDEAGVEAFIGAGTSVDDLGGKMVLPGMIPAHEHPILFMVLMAGLVLDFTGDKDAMLESLSEYVKANPDGPFYSFGGAWEALDFISRQEIDSIISDEPFLMIAASGHGGWANTKALEMAGITDVRQVGGVIDGRSFVPLLRGQSDLARTQRPLVWHYPNNWGPKGPGIGPSSAIRHRARRGADAQRDLRFHARGRCGLHPAEEFYPDHR